MDTCSIKIFLIVYMLIYHTLCITTKSKMCTMKNKSVNPESHQTKMGLRCISRC